LNDAAHTARDDRLRQIPPEIGDPPLENWRHAILCGLATHLRHDGRKQTKTRNLLERLRDRDEQVLLFARDLTVPFANNQAERDLRPVKTHIKISGCHRNSTGARSWLRIRGCISTARKHGINALAGLGDTITGNPLAATGPSRNLDGYTYSACSSTATRSTSHPRTHPTDDGATSSSGPPRSRHPDTGLTATQGRARPPMNYLRAT
jgi:hypothetical protein